MKKSILKTLSISLASLMSIGGLVGVALSEKKEAQNVSAANDDFDGNEIHFWTVNHTSGNSSGIWSWSGSIKKGYENSKIQINGSSTFTFTVSQANLAANNVTSYKWYLYTKGNNLTITINRGSAQLYSETVSSGTDFINKSSSFNSLDGSGDFTFAIKNNSSSITSEIYFENPNLKLFATIQKAVTISKGTGVSDVFLSTNSNATSGSASGTKFEKGKTVYGFATLLDGYSAPSGWTKVSGSTYRVGSTKIGDSDYSFGTMNANAVKYTIGYTLNGGAVAGTNPTEYYVTSNAITLINPTKTGYTFDGWSGTGISGKSTSVTIAKGSTGNRSYTANWSANTYIVSYDKNQPSNASTNVGNVPANATWTYDSNATLGSAPSLTGWTFGGWYKEAGCINLVGTAGQALTKPNLTSTKGATVKLYAKWTANTYNVSYNGNQPQNAPDGSEVTNVPSGATWVYDNAASYTLGSAPTFIDGYNFAGWYKEETCQTKVGDAGDTISKPNLATGEGTNVILYAKWEFDSNIQHVVDLINAIGEVSYPADKQAILDAETAYNDPGLSDNQKEILVSEGYAQTLTDARTQYESLRETAKNNTITAINNIGEVSYPNSKNAIIYAETLFASLDLDDQNASFITNKNVMDSSRTDYENDRAEAKNNVIAAIDAIGDIAYPSSKIALEYAEGLYNALDADDQNDTFITNKDVKDTARSNYNDARQSAVNGVITAINAINKPFDINRQAQIDNAQALFNTLDTNEQNSTWVTNLDRLEDAKAADAVADLFEALGVAYDTDTWREQVSGARTAFEALTSNQQGFINGTNIKSLLTDREDAIDVMDTINAIGDPHWTSTSKALIDAANDAYEAFVSSGKDANLIANYQKLVDANVDYNNVQSFVGKVNNVTSNPFEYTSVCKELIDEARGYYENTLDADQKGIAQTDASAYFNLLVNYENAYNAMYLIDQIGDLENTDACKQKIEAAKAAVDALNQTSELPLVNEDLLKELDDKLAAWSVIEEINALYPMSYGQSCEDAIKAARDSFNALTADQQALVINLDKLIKAENDYAKVKEVVEKVDNLGDIRYNQSSQTKINDARNAFEALTKDQKDIYPKDSLQTIVDYETAYEALGKIHNIGEVSYDTYSEDKINDSREFYDSLTDAQKRLIHASELEILTSSENEYGQLKKKANILVTILLIVVGLSIVGGAFFLFILMKKKDKDDEKDGTVKVASVGGLLPLILFVSHYADPSYISLYVLSGIAAILWLTIAGLVIYKKFVKKETIFTKKVSVLAVEEEGYSVQPSEAEVEANAILESVKKSEEESKLVIDKKGNLFQIRYIKSFTAKLSQSSDAVKEKYNELKNRVLSYDKVSSRVSWHYDSINASKEQLVKFSIRGKTLCVYFSPKIENPGEGYKLEDAKGNRYEKVPYLFRIKSDKKFEQVKDLIGLLMKRVGLKKGKTLNDDYKIPFESTEVLLQKGLIKELATHLEVKDSVKRELLKSVAVEKVDELMSDDTAESLIEDDIVVHQKIGKREIINVDTLSANFKDGDLVNLEALIEKKLVPSKTEYVKVLARGVLDKKLNVDLHDYSIQAVKMILLTGGTVKKIHE